MRAGAALGLALLLAAPLAGAGRGLASPLPSEESAATDAEPELEPQAPMPDWEDDLSPFTRGERAEPEPPLELGRTLLRAPEALTELALAPLYPVVLAFERWRLHERLWDLLTNEDNTFAVFPIVDPFNQSGLGLGAAVLQNEPLGSPDRSILLGVVRENRDRLASLSVSRRVPSWSGRVISGSAAYEVDRDTNWFGLGAPVRDAVRRQLRTDRVDLEGGLNLLDPSILYVDVEARLAFRRRRLEGGEGRFPAASAEDVLGVPAGFGRWLDYPEATLALRLDTRDTAARTTRGFRLNLEGSITHDVDGADTGGLRLTGDFTGYLPVLLLHRVLILSVGASLATPLGEGAQVPLHHLVNLGGSRRLRGYRNDRFIERLGWWATAEYRYKIWELQSSGNGLSASVFADLGQVGRDPSDLVELPLAWSVGFGLRAEMNLFALARFQIAYSPDGIRFSVGLGEF